MGSEHESLKTALLLLLEFHRHEIALNIAENKNIQRTKDIFRLHLDSVGQTARKIFKSIFGSRAAY